MTIRVEYDAMQVCLNGHRITSSANRYPGTRQAYCDRCGAATILSCEKCGTEIRGNRQGHVMVVAATVPKYCIGCGEPYPWQAAAIENLEAIMREGDLSEADMGVVVLALPDVLQETPKTELAALRLAKAMSKLGKPVYDIAIGVISDIASETAKKTMGLS